MGWTGIPGRGLSARDKRAELDRQYNGGGVELLKSSMVGSTYYCAYRVKETGEVHAGVAITHMEGGEFWYKDMTETMGPCEDSCPESIMKLLTPTDNGYASEWRGRCWARISQRKADARFRREALEGYAVCIIDAAGSTTYVGKLSERSLTRVHWLDSALVCVMERAEQMLATVKEYYGHCKFKDVSIVRVRRNSAASVWQLCR